MTEPSQSLFDVSLAGVKVVISHIPDVLDADLREIAWKGFQDLVAGAETAPDEFEAINEADSDQTVTFVQLECPHGEKGLAVVGSKTPDEMVAQMCKRRGCA